jgi:hypothetical protein
VRRVSGASAIGLNAHDTSELANVRAPFGLPTR